MSALDLELLRRWPGRLRFPDVLVALDDSPDATAPDPVVLGRAVLAAVGGMSAHAVFDDLLNRGEFVAAEHLLGQWPDARERGSADLAMRLASAREQAVVTVRQCVEGLVRRAESAGVRFDKPDLTELVKRASYRVAAADELMRPVQSRFEEKVEAASRALRDRITEQERSAGADAGQFASKQLLALLAAGELVAVRARLDREPVGAPIPEATMALPTWTGRWSPEEMLGYHLNQGKSRPPEFGLWKPSDVEARQVLTAYQDLSTRQPGKAAAAFATALDAFLGVADRQVTAMPSDGGHMAFIEGMFAKDHLSRLHPNGKVDLYIASPGTTAVPPSSSSWQPHIAVGPDLVSGQYTDRHSTAVLSLRDLLRLVVLPPRDRAVGLLSVVAPQWPVDALIGDTAEALDRILGDDPADRWLALRWITHLSLRGAASTAFAMDQCTGMDASLLRVALRYSQDVSRNLWNEADGGWRYDAALRQALRDVLLTRCGPPEAQAAWWAAVASCDDDTGAVGRKDLLEFAVIASDDDKTRDDVADGVEVLLANGLLIQQRSANELTVPLAGVVRLLRSEAEGRLIGTLNRMATRVEQAVVEPAKAWTAWHRNRFVVVPAYSAYVEAESAAADAERLATLVSAVRQELAEGQWANIHPVTTSLPELLTELAAQWRGEYPDVHLDLRCPPIVRVAVPVEVVKAALYEVLDNAAEAMPGAGDWNVTVMVTVNTLEVLVDVRDNGPGLPAVVRGRRIFGKGVSTRGTDRGFGLYRARQLLRRYSNSVVEADMEVIETPHPTLSGAALRVVLPEEEP
ncbi:ATP-binding protein [Lentzea sp. NPDC102401]|uniref:ATP-binding protein n=1 Tax=Lentzea sp. NPDC102401 TaxID=3364128 RepID=UPI00381D3EC7